MLAKISKTYPTVQKEKEFSPENSSQLHIEAQTYLLAEILQELRKMNNPPILQWDFSKERIFPIEVDRDEEQAE